MFFAYVFEQCFCLLSPRMPFKCMHTFKTRDLQNILFFSSKKRYFGGTAFADNLWENSFLGMESYFVFCYFFVIFEIFLASFYASIFGRVFWPKISQKWPQNLVHLGSLFRPFSRLWFFVVLLSLLGSLLTALWHPLGSFWHPSGSYWDPFGTLLAHIGTLLVPFRSRFGLFCTLGGLLLARFGRNSFLR